MQWLCEQRTLFSVCVQRSLRSRFNSSVWENKSMARIMHTAVAINMISYEEGKRRTVI
jgi:hypothetical protein